MKRTTSMKYNETTESRELFLYAINCGDLYRQQTLPAIAILREKAIKGTYNADKAVDIYYRIATAASDMYNREFGYRFSVADRFTAAVDMETYYREDEVFYGIDH